MKLTPGQNKALSILAFIVLVLLELLFLSILILYLFSGEKEDNQNIGTLIFVMVIFAMPLRWAYLTWKEQKAKSATRQHVSADVVAPISVTTKIDLSEYRKLHFQITYSRSWLIYIHIIAIAMLYFTMENREGEWVAYAFGLFIIYLPIAVYRSASSNYKATKMLHETLNFEFSAETLAVKGESFDSTNPWTTFDKVRILNKWFLLCIKNQPAVYIRKSAFASQEEMDKFKVMSNKIG